MKEFVIFVFSVDSKQNKVHVESHHEGFWYLCDHCKFEVGTKQGLRQFMKEFNILVISVTLKQQKIIA